jgi:hypothetical protein
MEDLKVPGVGAGGIIWGWLLRLWVWTVVRYDSMSRNVKGKIENSKLVLRGRDEMYSQAMEERR